MSNQGLEAEKQAGMQPGGTQKGPPKTVPSEEVGRGTGQDPESTPDEDEDEDEGKGADEPFEDRPTQPAPTKGADGEPSATQRPPSDS